MWGGWSVVAVDNLRVVAEVTAWEAAELGCLCAPLHAVPISAFVVAGQFLDSFKE